MSALASYVFTGERDSCPWDTLKRLAAEVGWTLTEPEPGVIQAAPAVAVTPQSQRLLMASAGIGPETRSNCWRGEYMARICREAGLDFKGPSNG